MSELQRRRELERLSKPELITTVIEVERALSDERAGRGRFETRGREDAERT